MRARDGWPDARERRRAIQAQYGEGGYCTLVDTRTSYEDELTVGDWRCDEASGMAAAVMAGDGSETTAPLSLEGLESIDEVREALCELCAEVLDDDTLQAEDLLIEMRDVVGRTRPLTDSTQISAVLRAKSLRVKPRAASRGAADFA